MKFESLGYEQSGPKNYYDVLGISQDASPEEIKDAYRKMVKATHPDAVGDDSKRESFHKINEAYETLIDGDKRAVYDHTVFNRDHNESSEFKNLFMENSINDILEYITYIVGKEPQKARDLRKNLLDSLHFEKDGKKIEKYNTVITFLNDKLGKVDNTEKDILHGRYYDTLTDEEKKMFNNLIKDKTTRVLLEVLVMQKPEEFEKLVGDHFVALRKVRGI